MEDFKSNKRILILNTVADLVANFTYYDRKEDEDLSREDLINSIKNDEVTIDEIVFHFKHNLESVFK